MPLRAAMPITVTRPTSEPSDKHAAGQKRRGDRADQRERQRQEHQRGQPHRAEVRQQDQDDADHRRAAPHQQRSARRRARGILAQHFGVVAGAEIERRQPGLDVARDRAEIAARHVAGHVDAARRRSRA